MFVLPNRKAFADFITRAFKRQYRNIPRDDEDESVDLCTKGTSSVNELLPHQKLVRDYLMAETPYRGLLVYHGLGSGKTCTSIAVAESLLSTKKVYVLAPASLLTNFKNELLKCGDPIYRFENHWEVKVIRSAEDRELGKSLGISETFLDKNGAFYVTVPERPPNFSELPNTVQKGIKQQISEIIDNRFTLIAYNGLSKNNIDTLFPPDKPNMFDDCVVIVDEAHNLIGSVVNDSLLRTRVYDYIYNAKNCKVVALSGTPVINSPHEIAFMMNMLRGPIERVVIPTDQAISWDEGMMTSFFRSMQDVDTVEYNSVKRTILLTRNPPHFESVFNEKNERIAVKFNKDLLFEEDIAKWVDTWRQKFASQFGGVELSPAEKITKEELECLPTKYEDFVNMFVDGLSIKNAFMFQRRIQGLVSYFKGADERLIPKRTNTDAEALVKVPMSEFQFNQYLEKRWKEIQIDSRRGRTKVSLNDDLGSYRTNSRLVCNFAIPEELRVGITEEGEIDEDNIPEKSEVLQKLKASPERYLTEEAVKLYSPKFAEALKNVKASVGEPFQNQMVYSNFKELEGLGIFGAILEANGFQQYRIKKEGGIWIEDPDMKPNVPAFAFFVGAKGEGNELYRQIFNNRFNETFPATLKESIKEKRLCVLLVSPAGAEGISLENVRHVHILESYWNVSRIDQVIGRAIRICSHARLPVAERTVKVNLYISTFSQEQQTGIEGPNIVMIRRNDMVLRRYDTEEPTDTFMSTDEYLYEVAYEKGRIGKALTHLLKQAAVDCEIHRKLHSREQPIIQCMRFDTTTTAEDLAFKPNYATDERDALYMRNIKRVKRRLQIIKIQDNVMILDPDTNEIFDYEAFDDNHRLLKIGTRTAPNEITFFG